MRIAIVVSGNLRTFFMPYGKLRLCDEFLTNIVEQNSADLFFVTDTNDFYLNGSQYFSNNKIEILNNYTYRLHNKIEFITSDEAKKLIFKELKIFYPYLKSLMVEDPYCAEQDPKIEKLRSANVSGNNPILVIQQLRKMYLGYQLLKSYEQKNSFCYDVILRWRFDNTINGPLKLNLYEPSNIVVPGVHSPIIYDWFAYGGRKAMDVYLSLYERVGDFLDEGKIFICSECSYYGADNHHCEGGELHEITLSVEYHLFRAFQEHNIKPHNTTYQSCPYRYNSLNMPFDEFVKKNNIKGTVCTYKPNNEILETIL